MKRIGVITSTRAEFGLLSPVIVELRKHESDQLKVELVVTGTHLSDEYGHTIDEIIQSGLRIDHQIMIPVASTTTMDISENQADTLVKFTELFQHQEYDAIVILGDRYEMLMIAIAAGNTRTPIFHLCGGDTTEGALDEWIRHAITKIAYLHFPTNEESYKRVIQLGENPSRVFNYGSTSIDNILCVADMKKEDALHSIGLQDCKYALCTYHPVTMEDGSVDQLVENFIDAIRETPELQFIVTKSNADQGGARINELLDLAEESVPNLHVYTSLGVRRYLSLMRYAEFVLGNSSSGIIETPAFGVATINIGNRQRGRLQSESIINCEENTVAIRNAIQQAQSVAHQALCRKVISPYGDGHAAERIAERIVKTLTNQEIDLKKKFYDL